MSPPGLLVFFYCETVGFRFLLSMLFFREVSEGKYAVEISFILLLD